MSLVWKLLPLSFLSLATKHFQLMHHLSVQLEFTPPVLEEDISFIAKNSSLQRGAIIYRLKTILCLVEIALNLLVLR